MKKLILPLALLAGAFTFANAEEVTLDLSTATDVKGEIIAASGNNGEHYEVTEMTVGAYKLTFTQGEGGSAPAYYPGNARPLRVYKGSTMTIAGPVDMGSIKLVYGSLKGIDAGNLPTVDAGGTVSVNTGDKYILWNRPDTEVILNSVTFTMPTAKGADNNNPNLQMTQIVVSTEQGEVPDVPQVTNYKFTKATSIESGKQYAIFVNGKVATQITSNYGYLKMVDVTLADGTFETIADNAFTFTASGDGYTIRQNDGRYLYMKGTYNSFNVDAEAVEGSLWKAEIKDGNAVITNVAMGKTMYFSQEYGNIGAYAEATDDNLTVELYLMGEAGSVVTPPDTPADKHFWSGLLETSKECDWTFTNVTLPEGVENVWSWRSYDNLYYLNGSAHVNGDDAVQPASEAYAVSPVIDLAGSSKTTLTFDHACKYQTTLRDLCGLCIREEGTEAWTALTIPTWPEAGSWDYVNAGVIDLSAYDGKKVQLAFKYASSVEGADTWRVRNVFVDNSSSVSVMDVVSDEPAVYCDLNGRVVSADRMENGIYIERRGSEARKIVIRR